jgi:putative DNA-binding protein
MNPTSATAGILAESAQRTASLADRHAKNPRSATGRVAAGIAPTDGARSRLDPTTFARSGMRVAVRESARRTGGVTATALSTGLANRFPVVKRLVGDALFKSMVQAYAVADPARLSAMLPFGDGFPAFIDHFEPARPIPYLGDMARLEQARALARRAPAVAPFAADAFTAPIFDRLAGMRVRLHPSLSVVVSLHPIHSIWHMNRNPVRFTPASPFVSEAVLVSRPRLRVRTWRITHGDAAFVFALKAGYRLAAAMTAAIHVVPCARPADSLAMLIHAGAVIAFDEASRPAPPGAAASATRRPAPQLVPA